MTFTDLLLQVDSSRMAGLWADLGFVGVKFLLNLIVTFIIVRLIFPGQKHQRDYIFTFFVFNILIFFLCHLMTHVELSIGFAFGLFALFSIMRYRTATIGIKEMTYLFSVVCVGVINAIVGPEFGLPQLALINLAILLSIFLSERAFFSKALLVITIRYDNIEFIKQGKYDLLKADLESRIGCQIEKVDIQYVNYLNDSAELMVYYKNEPPFINSGEKSASSIQKEKVQEEKISV